jgi:hypothetical protein
MKKLLTATGTALLLANMTVAPAFADSLAQQTTPGKQQQVVLPEGQMMSDAELAQVEGEVAWVPVALGVVGAGFGGYTSYQNCAASGRKDCWVDASYGAAQGAFFGATLGRGGGSGGTRFFQNGQRINGIRVFTR